VGFGGETALVTGGASGIGLALGAELAASGAQVVLADIDGDAAERAAADLPGSVRGCALDVRDADAFRALVGEIGEIDLLCNNAGIAMGGPTHELTADHWDRAIDVNIRGVVNGVLAAYPAMVERGRGHILNTASGAGLVAPPFVAAYAMSKHAVVGLSLGLRSEAALHGVRVSVLCPGSVETPILDRPPPADLPPTPSEPVTARAYLAVVRQKPVPADDIARSALRAVERNRGIIVVPAAARPLWYLHRLSPTVVDLACRRLARTVQRELVRPRPADGDRS
jgi:NAD(P)-dependent dehydrogenase (short-subunit alcohol dehydrogenase family)